MSHDLKRLLNSAKRYRCSCRTFNCHYGTVHADFNRGIGCHRIKGYGMAGILGIPFVIIPVIAINLFGKKKQVSQTAVNPSMEEEI